MHQPDPIWWRANRRFDLAAVSKYGAPKRIASPSAWAEFIRDERSQPKLSDYSLSVVPRERAELC